MRYSIVYFADLFDHYIIGHRWPWLCDKIGLSSWWDK